jgi:NADH-quinone oxidoreductase subunit C
MTAEQIIETLSRTMSVADVEAIASADGMPTIVVAPQALVATAGALRDTPELRFAFLADITAVDYHPREPRYEIIYLLASLGVAGFGDTPKRLRLKVRVPGGEAAVVPTVSGVWPAADWAEREVWDFFGVHFEGHPDMRRLLMPDDWEGHPLRKDFPVQIKQPVKTTWPLQVSAEQFVANIEAARERARKE